MNQFAALLAQIRANNQIEALDLLESNPNFAIGHADSKDDFHYATALHWAAHRNLVVLVDRLIDLGADVNDSSSDWWLTPLAWGADAASAESVDRLIAHGACVNQDVILGMNSLHVVAMGGSSKGKANPVAYVRTAELLIANGVTINHAAANGRTPLDEAIDAENHAIVELLRRNGAKLGR